MTITQYLRQHGLSQKEFGERVGVSQSMVAQWIGGLCPVSPQSAKKIDAATAGAIPKYELRPDLWEPAPQQPRRAV